MDNNNRQFNSSGINSRILLLIALIILFIIASVLVFVFRDDIGEALGAGKSSGSSSEPFSFTSGSLQVYDALGNGLVVASTTGIEVMDSGGREVTKKLMSLSTPAIVSSDEHAAVFDSGSTEMEIVDLKGNIDNLDQEDNIITATMNEKGWLSVCTDEKGYNGKVIVYNKELESVYEWYSGEGYLLTAAVSPDCSYLATLTVTSKGGAVHLLKLDSEKEIATFNSENEFIIDLAWISNSTIAALGDSKASFIGNDGKKKAEFIYDNENLSNFAYGDGFAVIMLSDTYGSKTGTLLTIGEDGSVLGKTAIESELESLDANRKEIAVLCSDGAKLLTQSMSQVGVADTSKNTKNIVLRKNGDVFLIFTNSAEIRKF